MGQNKGLPFILLSAVIVPINSPVSTGCILLFINTINMADHNNNNKRRYQRHSMDSGYMVDSGRVFQFPFDTRDNSGHQKPERQMLALVVTWLFYWLGLPCWVIGLLTYVLGWLKEINLSELTVIVGAILSVSKVVIMWAEKGDVVWARCKRLFKKKRRQRIK